jgi:hypothetical protein
VGSFLYYSTQTVLAFRICKRYFQGKFYVHCCEEFDPKTNADSSNPASLKQYFEGVARNEDTGSAKFRNVKTKLKQVALQKRRAGDIDDFEYKALTHEIACASTNDARPLLFLIAKSKISSDQRSEVPIQHRANRDSIEYVIRDLEFSQFEYILDRLEIDGKV